MNLVESTFERLKPPDLRRDPREELRDMSLKERARAIFAARLPTGATLADDHAPDPYDDSPAAAGRAFTVLRAGLDQVVLIQIPRWVADDGRSVGALDETRYAFRGKTVRIISEGLDAPSLGLDTLVGNWKLEKIDAEFVAWRYVQEMGAGRHTLSRVLRLDLEARADAVVPASGAAAKVFVSYAREDASWHDMLMKQLAPLRRAHERAIWSDHALEAGEEWMRSIVAALAASPIVVLLISPSFIDSEFIKAREFDVAMQAAKAGGKRLLWVYVTACAYETIGIAAYQAAHDITTPLDQLERGTAWAELKKVHDSVAKALAKLGG